METVGVRQLRQYASEVLGRVKAGETVEITERGRVVARLVPIDQQSRYQQLVAEGRIVPARQRLADVLKELGPPPAAKPGERPLSEILDEMRTEDRY